MNHNFLICKAGINTYPVSLVQKLNGKDKNNTPNMVPDPRLLISVSVSDAVDI